MIDVKFPLRDLFARLEEPMDPELHKAAGLFGAILGGMAVVWNLFVAIMIAAGGLPAWFLVLFGLAGLGLAAMALQVLRAWWRQRRSDAASIAAAPIDYWKARAVGMVQLLLAALFLYASLRPGPWASWLGELMELEALTLAAALFLGQLVILDSGTRRGRVLQLIAFALLGGVFVAAGVSTGGLRGFFELGMLVIVTYGGQLLRPNLRRLSELAIRWGMSVGVFLVAVLAARIPSDLWKWQAQPEVLTAGAIFFGLLGAIEASGVYVFLFGGDFERVMPLPEGFEGARRNQLGEDE